MTGYGLYWFMFYAANSSLQQHRSMGTQKSKTCVTGNELKQLSWNFKTLSGTNQGILFS